jgi:hypothetical protein
LAQGNRADFLGHSIGGWVDVDNDGKYDALKIETRGLKGPRTYEGTGMPFQDNETVVKERIFLDPANSDALTDEITVIDHALTRPRTITQRAHSRFVPSSGLVIGRPS